MTQYRNGDLWQQAKEIAEAAQYPYVWIEIISYYNEQGGKNVQLYTLVEGENKRVVLVLDDYDVLVLDKEGNPEIIEYEVADKGIKTFYYVPKQEKDIKTIEVKVPKGYEGIDFDSLFISKS